MSLPIWSFFLVCFTMCPWRKADDRYDRYHACRRHLARLRGCWSSIRYSSTFLMFSKNTDLFPPATALSEGRLSVLFTTSSSDPPSTSPIYPCKRKNASSGQHTNTAPDVMPPKRASEEDIAVAAPQDSEHDGFGPPFTPSLKEPCFTKQRDAKPAALPPSAKGSAARHAIISATLQVPPSPSAKGSKARLDAISEALATLCLQDSWYQSQLYKMRMLPTKA